MKLRIKGNSIRIRLTKSEVDFFAECGEVEELIEFGTSHLFYTLRSSKEHTEITATYTFNVITVFMPENMAKEFTDKNITGFENTVDFGVGPNGERKLFILIEKDFVCLDNTLEDQSDNYPNPNATC